MQHVPSHPVSDLNGQLAGLDPRLNTGKYTFVYVEREEMIPWGEVLGMLREKSGWSLILPLETAVRLKFDSDFIAAWITLRIYSDLLSVGLTKIVSARLAAKDIPCNIVAAYHHDHLFVPFELAEDAMNILTELQSSFKTN